MSDKKTRSALGIYIGTASVDAVVLVETEGKVRPVGRYSVSREEEGGLHGASDATQLIAGLKDSQDSDYTIQFGGGSGDSFLDSELQGFGVGMESSPDTVVRRTLSLAREFEEILSKCRAAGHEVDLIALCEAPPDLLYRRTKLDALEKTPGKAGSGRFRLGSSNGSNAKRSQVSEIATVAGSEYDADRAGLLPMRSGGGLVVLPLRHDSAVVTLEELDTRDTHVLARVSSLDADINVFRHLVARSPFAANGQITAVVRVGSTETVLLFFAGSQLAHYELLRSVTVYDAPETVCSRVLLQIDENDIGDPDTILIASSSRLDELKRAFSSFFSEAVVEPFQQVLDEFGLGGQVDDGEYLRIGPVLATGVALGALHERELADAGLTLNLLPRRIARKRRQKAAIRWHTWALLPVLFGLSLFYVRAYVSNSLQISERRQALLVNPPAPPVADPAVVQSRIDSLQQAYRRYTMSLRALDSLLVGSDRWSAFLESVTRATRDLSGVWIDSWSYGTDRITLDGTALSRTRVAQLARRLDGAVDFVSSDEIKDKDKDVRVYRFTMTVPVPKGVPKVAEYLRNQAEVDSATSSGPAAP